MDVCVHVCKSVCDMLKCMHARISVANSVCHRLHRTVVT